MASRSWEVLLVGGASGVGKTSLSRPLARHYGLDLIFIDDFQVVLTKLTTPEQQPVLHYWRTHWDEFLAWTEDERHCYFRRMSTEVFRPAVEAVIAMRLEDSEPFVLDGDFILPDLCLAERFDGQANDGRVRALFVYEPDEAQVAANYLVREGDAQVGRAHSSWVNSEWLRAECARLGVAAVAARPWDTVLDRAIAALDR